MNTAPRDIVCRIIDYCTTHRQILAILSTCKNAYKIIAPCIVTESLFNVDCVSLSVCGGYRRMILISIRHAILYRMRLIINLQDKPQYAIYFDDPWSYPIVLCVKNDKVKYCITSFAGHINVYHSEEYIPITEFLMRFKTRNHEDTIPRHDALNTYFRKLRDDIYKDSRNLIHPFYLITPNVIDYIFNYD